jgi:deoxyribodipyrimidine photo-lyase
MTLRAHRQDRRAVVYSANQLREAETHDPLWNAAQGQLRRDGFIHGELRTLWAKKIIEWTESPEQALDIAVELVNTYALDGRDPLAYARIGWAFGLFDRPWSPERPIFGTVRYVASASTRSQLRALSYMTRFQPVLNGSGEGIR